MEGFYLKERPPTLMRALRRLYAHPGHPHYSLLGFRVPKGNPYVVVCFTPLLLLRKMSQQNNDLSALGSVSVETLGDYPLTIDAT